MPELKTAGGKAVDLPDDEKRAGINATFEQAMNADPDGDEAKAPPRKAPPATMVPRSQDAPRRRARTPKDEKARTASKAPSVALSDAQRAEGVKGLAQLGAGLCLMAGKATGSDAWRADAITIASNADEIADACVQTAKANAAFAATLDKVCAAGPWGALIGVAVGVGSQIARNHRPGLSLPNTMDPKEILRLADEQEQENLPQAA